MSLKTSRPSEWDQQAPSWDNGIHSPGWPHYHYYRTFDLYLPVYLAGCRRALELGCGTGDSILSFQKHVEELCALDFSTEMIRIAQRKLKRRDLRRKVQLLRADALALPFQDASFDGAYGRGALVNYVPDPSALFGQLRRILRPGGRIVFDMIRGKPGGEAILYSADQITQILTDSGFERIEFKPMGIFVNLRPGTDARVFANRNRDAFCNIEMEMADCFNFDKAVMLLFSASARGAA